MKFMNEMKVMERARVITFEARPAIYQRLIDLGLCEGTEILCLGSSPMGDPRAYLIGGAVIAIRNCDCNNITVDTCISEELT